MQVVFFDAAVLDVGSRVANRGERRDRHAVNVHHLIVLSTTVDLRHGECHAGRSPDVGRQPTVGRRDHHTRNEGCEGRELLTGRNDVEHIARHNPLLVDVLNVNQRTRARHGDGFRHVTDAELRVDGRRETGRQRNPFALDGREPLQHEHDCVHARRKLHQLVIARFVSRNAPGLFNQGGAGRLHGDPGENRPGRIADHAVE